ncbi:MAG TPA: decaprenyl-phosphate phosphoribosyltransferase, partial [Ilumatobacteraceae bacterium]|nr:decaprenyl-phosphate phosphoribosyltransferase [Ilumatobacteraceae bacterium]
ARPKQWAKNVLVFAAPGAAGVLTEATPLLEALVIFVAFCLASAGTYYWNDILDVEADRVHVKKRFRPIASGAVPLGVARVVGVALLAAGIGLSFTTRWQAGVACIVYIVLTSTYSAIWKHIAVVDLIAVASGFVIRAIAGAAATAVPMSSWFLLVTSFGALFIVTGKRYAELREHGESPSAARATLNDYSLGFLRIVLSVSCGATLVAYCIWAFEAADLAGAEWPLYQLSIVPMLAALLRYLLILEQGHGAAPEEIFIADRTLQVLGLVWVVIFGLAVYVN